MGARRYACEAGHSGRHKNIELLYGVKSGEATWCWNKKFNNILGEVPPLWSFTLDPTTDPRGVPLNFKGFKGPKHPRTGPLHTNPNRALLTPARLARIPRTQPCHLAGRALSWQGAHLDIPRRQDSAVRYRGSKEIRGSTAGESRSPYTRTRNR